MMKPFLMAVALCATACAKPAVPPSAASATDAEMRERFDDTVFTAEVVCDDSIRDAIYEEIRSVTRTCRKLWEEALEGSRAAGNASRRMIDLKVELESYDRFCGGEPLENFWRLALIWTPPEGTEWPGELEGCFGASEFSRNLDAY